MGVTRTLRGLGGRHDLPAAAALSAAPPMQWARRSALNWMPAVGLVRTEGVSPPIRPRNLGARCLQSSVVSGTY